LISELATERLRLRPWRHTDREPFAALNADPRVMAHFQSPLTRGQSDAMAARIQEHFDRHGFGLWAVEVPGITAFAGFIGLCIPHYATHFTPCVEIGWRLSTEHWDRGYATEGAAAALQFGFERLQLAQIVALTVPGNVRSRRVMEKLGMKCSAADDFDHPLVSEGHPLRRHVLYRIDNPAPRRVVAPLAEKPERRPPSA
jgi:RimJ/RimL family protein N-acetyltransferase